MIDYSQYSDEDLRDMLSQSKPKADNYSQYSDEDLIKMLEDKQAPQEQGLLSKLGNRAKAIGQEMGNYPGSMIGPGDPVHVLGQVAGGINDIATSAAKGLYNTVVPQQARQAIGDFANEAFSNENPIGGALSSALRGAGKLKQKLDENYPETGRYAEDVMNIAGAVPIVGGAVKTFLGAKNAVNIAKETIATQADKNIASKPYSWLAKTKANYDKQLSDVISKHYSAAASPTTLGKRTYGKMEGASENTTNAVNHIVQDSLEAKLPVPQTLEETSKAIDFGIKKRLETASALSGKAGEQGVIVTGQKAINDVLDPLINNTNISESTIATAQKIKELILKNPARTPVDMEELIRTTNSMSKPFFRAGDNAAGKVAADASKALRSEMMDTLKSAGPVWQKARNEVRDLMSVQGDINKSWGVDLRKKGFGFMDIGNIYSMGELGAGITMANPTMIARGLTASAMKTYMKYMNQKNTQIGAMFEKAEKIITRKNKISDVIKGLKPQGPTELQQVPKQIGYTRQMPMQDVSGQPSSYTPPLQQPTMKAIGYDRATTPINLGMLDDSSVKVIKGAYNNPDFWIKNKDLTNTLLKIKNKQPMIMEEWNTLLERVMMNRMGSDINARIPLKSQYKVPPGSMHPGIGNRKGKLQMEDTTLADILKNLGNL